MVSSDDLLTPNEVAAILRVRADFVRDLVRRGEMHGYAIGGPKKRRIVVPRGSLNAYLKACEVKNNEGIEPPRATAPLSAAGYPLLKKYGSKG